MNKYKELIVQNLRKEEFNYKGNWAIMNATKYYLNPQFQYDENMLTNPWIN